MLFLYPGLIKIEDAIQVPVQEKCAMSFYFMEFPVWVVSCCRGRNQGHLHMDPIDRFSKNREEEEEEANEQHLGSPFVLVT